MQLPILFGKNVRNYRKANGLTQEQLAKRVNVSMETIGKIERGAAAPTFTTAERIAEALDVPVAVLFGADESTALPGERGRLTNRINQLLSRSNNEQLARINRIIEAFLGL